MDNPATTPDLKALWSEIAAAIQTEVSADTFARWFKDVQLTAIDEAELTLRVPNNIYQVWIETNYLPLLRSAVLLTLGKECALRFIADEAIEPEAAPARNGKHKAAAVEEEDDEPTPLTPGAHGLNPRNTFDSFVVGAANEFAAGACRAVADQPGKTYNPLFIHGGTGLGKTHLLHAIGHQIMERRKGSRVLYITSERFTNEFIDAIQTSSLQKFRKRYRHTDVLLIDDIQFLAGKERSQEEFFHTFNTLFDGHKQIVLSSDRPPSEISDLEQRLVSRFDWGLTAELQPPDTETRVAILRKKAMALAVPVHDDILQFLAARVRTNVRTLEGALTRVASYASLSGKVPALEKVEHLLRDILQQEARRMITIDQIQKRVADHFDIRLADMTSKRRPANIAFPRQVAMYLARELTKSSLSEIGDAFGGRDHGTVLHAHRLVKDRIKQEDQVKQTVAFLDSQLQRGNP